MNILCENRIFHVTLWIFSTFGIVSAGIACLADPCVHGICIDDINSTTYACYCIDGYTGVQCQTNWDECWSEPCQNGGTCIDGIASYNCTCPEGFIGDNCETNYNECESNPCENNGTCIDMNNGFVCSCVPGFSGEHCELDIAVCNSSGEVRCYNGGECIEGPGIKYYCKCLAGWTGRYCEDQIDECKSNPCNNGGICVDAHADYMCACTYGYTGKSCEIVIQFCSEDSCSNNALCVVEEGERVCYCVPDYHGERCELQYDECLLGPRCMNGGSCIDGVDNFTCSCPPNLTGALCECLILDDGSQDCEYISPTTPESTTSFMITTIEEMSTEHDIYTSTTYGYNYNDTIGRTKATYPETDITTIISLSTTMESTTDEFKITTEVGNLKTTTEPVNSITITPFESTIHAVVTEEPEETKAPIDSENSRTEPDLTPATRESDIKSTTSTSYTETEVTTSLIEITTTEETTKHTTKVSTTTESEDMSVVTTTKLLKTTEKMFTDTPTEQIPTELPTFESHTTEATDLTTPVDDSTISTVQSECSDSVCNYHGICVNTLHGIRCHCNFKFGGKFCEDRISISTAAFGGNSFISHKLYNTTSININFIAKTLITEGQIMRVDIAKEVYMELFISSGLLKFKFSCGYQTMLLGELKTFVNKGYDMKIETRLDLFPEQQHCNATLHLNDTVAMSGGQIANITSLNKNPMLYLGKNVFEKDTEPKPFIGCIRDLIVNGEKHEIFGDALDAGDVSECSSLVCLSAPCQNGGSCSDHSEGYSCSCSNGWMGDHCNQSVCDHNPCQSGGRCVPHPGSGFLCLCPYGKHGIFCEYNVDITRPSFAPITNGISSYIIYPLSLSAMNSDRFDLRLRFQTPDMDQIALLAFVGQNGRHDSKNQHLALTFVKGYVMLTWNMGNGPRRIFTSRAIAPRRGGHSVRVWRRGRTGGLSVDGRYNATGNAAASADTKMTLLPYIYIGGHPSEEFRDLPHDLPLHSGWRGCIWEVGGQAVGSGKAIRGQGVGQCGVAQCTAKSCNAPRGVCIHSPASYGCICHEGWFGATCSSSKSPCDRSVTQCQGSCVVSTDRAYCDCPYGKTGLHCDQDLIPTDVLFTGTRSYVQLQPRTVISVSLVLEAEVRPIKPRGLVIFVETPHFYTTLSLQGGLLEYRWTDKLSGISSLVRSNVVISMSQWHNVKAGRYGSRLYVWVDGSLSTEAMLAHAYPHTSTNATINIGGVKDLSTLPFDAILGPPESYTGCLRNLHVNNVLLPLENNYIKEGQNLADCDGTPCGSETCEGAACTIENGQAICACPSSPGTMATPNRCRRHVGCSAKSCVKPSGVCRAGTCVCSAGYAGFHCENKINITIPQFKGNGFLALNRRYSITGRVEEQRVNSMRPSFIAFNFTTAELNGLLLWITIDMDYIGVGIENGYLKVTWSFLKNNSTMESDSAKNTRFVDSFRGTRLVPHVGFLADAEWHMLVLRMNSNVTITVDKMLAYVEETGMNDQHSHEYVDTFIGGVSDNDIQAKLLFAQNFKGCTDKIAINEDSYIENFTEIYSENIKSCQLFP